MATTERLLEGRSAIVTGGGHGLGRAYAHRLAGDGAAVVIAELDEEAGGQVAAEIRDAGGSAMCIATDVGDEKSVDAMTTAALSAFGRIDILVNNAAMFASVPVFNGGFEEVPLDHFEKVLRVNVIGTWLCARSVVPDMRSRQYGKIINISSGTDFKGSAADMIQYVTSKSAILGFTRCLARTLGKDGIRVNCVAPGNTVVDGELDESPVAETGQRRPGRGANLAERALQRPEVPDDVVGTVAFLASKDSDFITGQTIVVDGGAFMH